MTKGTEIIKTNNPTIEFFQEYLLPFISLLSLSLLRLPPTKK